MAPTSATFREWWDHFERPQQLLDKEFGKSLNGENLTKLLPMPPLNKPFKDYLKPWGDLMTEVSTEEKTDDKKKYEITVDVKNFQPEDIQVKTVDNNIIVEAKHEEKKNENGYSMRQFVKRYLLPNEYDIEKVTCRLSTDGVLTILAPTVETPITSETKEN